MKTLRVLLKTYNINIIQIQAHPIVLSGLVHQLDLTGNTSSVVVEQHFTHFCVTHLI